MRLTTIAQLAHGLESGSLRITAVNILPVTGTQVIPVMCTKEEWANLNAGKDASRRVETFEAEGGPGLNNETITRIGETVMPGTEISVSGRNGYSRDVIFYSSDESGDGIWVSSILNDGKLSPLYKISASEIAAVVG